MGGLINTWNTLTLQKRAILLVTVASTFAGIILLASWAQRPTLSLLYAGLEPSDAGRMIGELEQLSIAYEVRGDAIFVDAGARDRVRMSLAERGLPRRGPAGYELLDSLDGFGTTTEMFDATYWRAKEGELARTILSLPGIIEARVHIANTKRRAFARQGQSSSAAITVRTAGGYSVQMRQALAVRYLVALAVPGLTPDQVTVIDADAGVLLKPGDGGDATVGPDTALEHERRLSQEVSDLLAARVGEGRARVQVAVEIDRESEAVSERIIDPESRVAIHSDNEELSESSTGGTRGSVTVASNLPEGDAQSGSGGAQSNRTETRERTNYEISETKRERRKEAGAIKRLSIAVLVDGIRTVAADGTETWAERPAAELEALRELVQSAVGFNEVRGDVVTIETLKFADIADSGELLPQPGLMDQIMVHLPQLIQAVILALVLILVAIFVVGPMFRRGPAPTALPTPAVPAIPAAGSDQVRELAHEQGALGSQSAAEQAAPEIPQGPTAVLKSIAQQRPEDASALLKAWLSATPETEEPI